MTEKSSAKSLLEKFREIPEGFDQLCQGPRENNNRPGDKVSDTKIKFDLASEPRPATRHFGNHVYTYAGSHCEIIKEKTMLVLSRKKNETIIIDGRIKVEILKIKGNTIRLGISAPKDVKVLRGELSPFDVEREIEIEGEADDINDLQMVVEEKTHYVQQAGGFPVSADEAASLPNPFAVIAG